MSPEKFSQLAVMQGPQRGFVSDQYMKNMYALKQNVKKKKKKSR